MATISLPGLTTGIDTTTLISQLVDAERGYENILKAQKTTSDQMVQAYTDLTTQMDSLKSAADALRTASSLRSYTATSSNSATMTVSADSSASEGSHEVVINRLASAERDVHGGVASADTKVGAGSFTYQYNGTTRTVQTTADTTLQGLTDLINNDAGNPGVSANILQYDPDGTGTQGYHLVLNGNDSGADYAIHMVDAQTTLNGTGGTVDFRQASFTTTQNAQNSQISVDGYPGGSGWIERSSNTISDVIPGVTLNLLGTTTGTNPVNVSLTRDTSALKDKINTLVTSYNSVVDFIAQQTAYNTTTKTAGILMGEYTASYASYAIGTPFADAAPGFLDGADPYTLASQIGLSVDKDGHLQFDSSTFDTAAASNYQGVLSLLGAAGSGASDSSDLSFYGSTSSTKAGDYDVRATFVNGVLQSAQIKLSSESDANWRDASVQGNLITGTSKQPEAMLQVAASHTGSGTVTAHVRVREGAAGALYDQVTDLETNAIKLSEDRASANSDELQTQIDNEDKRVADYQTQLEATYANLEQTLTLLQSQEQALSSMTGSTSSSTKSSS